jgi:hypothetical protein
MKKKNEERRKTKRMERGKVEHLQVERVGVLERQRSNA